MFSKTTIKPKFVGGVSHRGPVAGALGIGKVKLKFRPIIRNDPIKRLRHVLGLILYTTFIGTMIFSYAWYLPNIRYRYVYPSLQRFYHVLDYSKYLLLRCLNYQSFLSQSNNIRIDPHGVPTITADNISHALFLQGYMHASSRLMQMEIYRRTALGTLSELYGKATLESDKLYRTLNIAHIARQDVFKLDTEDYQLLVAYSNGVNQFITNEQWSLSLDFTLLLWGFNSRTKAIHRWEPFHTLAMYRLIAYEWGSGWEEELLELLMKESMVDLDTDQLWFSKSRRSSSFTKRKSHTVGDTSRDVNGSSGNVGSQCSFEYITKDGVPMLPSISGLVIAVSANRTDGTAASYLINSLTSKVHRCTHPSIHSAIHASLIIPVSLPD